MGPDVCSTPEGFPNLKTLGQVIERHRVTTLWLTASLFNTVIDDAPEILRPIRQLLIGGEALSVTHVRQAHEQLPNTQIINGYGPTENTTFTCCHTIPKVLDDKSIHSDRDCHRQHPGLFARSIPESGTGGGDWGVVCGR